MPSTLKLLLGDAGSGKTQRLLMEYRAALREQRELRRPGRVLWIAPTHRAAQAIIQRLLDADEPVQFTPQVITFDVFAEQILAAAGRPATPISSVMKRLLLRRIVGDLSDHGKLSSFSSVCRTSGFLDVVSSFISELKREEIWPEEFLTAAAYRPVRLAKRDRELGLIYERYQQHLATQNWYDTEGRFWLARTALGEGVRGQFASVEFLAVDGFVDFTQTQYEILGHMLGWIRQAIITLPHESAPRDTRSDARLNRPELFTKPHETIAAIRRHIPADTVWRTEHLVADRSNVPAGLRTISELLFSNPRSITQSENADGLEMIAATGPDGERRAAAMRIKRLLHSGVRPSQIVVAMRNVSESGIVWAESLDEAGIPTWCEAGTPLNTSPIIKALFSVLQLEMEDWPFPRLMQVIDSNYFQPNWHELASGRGPRAVAAALRKLKLHNDRELILRVLTKRAERTLFDDLSHYDSGAHPVLALAAKKFLTRLSQATDRLRRRHTLTEWVDVIASLGEELGWLRAMQSTSTEAAADDSRDWDLLQGIIRTAAEADRQFATAADASPEAASRKRANAGKEPRLTLDDFVAELRDLLRSERIRPPSDPGGCVRVLDVEQARHLDVPYLFLVGLSESSFPQNRMDDCLFGETERQEFAKRGVNLKHREQHQRDEMFLFYSIVTRAHERLTLSYPAVNSTGQPIFPSPYVAALRSLFSSTGLLVAHEGQLDPVPAPDEILTESDLRLASITAERRGDSGLFVTLFERPGWLATGHNILAAMDMNSQRFHERGFTPYEGRLDAAFNLAAMQQRFGPRHQFSATELEAYATCPYRYWVTSVLNVDELGSPEQGTDHAARGSLIHDVLAQLLREGIIQPPDELAARFVELVEERLSQRFHETDLQRALARIESRLMADMARAFAEQQTKYHEKLTEVWAGRIGSLAPEISFGRLPDGSEFTDQPVHSPLTFGSPADAVQVRGRIDRVDIGSSSGNRVFNVIDYKTGQPPRSNEKELISGRAIQLALYALAVRRLGLAGDSAEPFSIGYWSLKTAGFIRGYQKNTEDFVGLKSDQVDSLERILDHVIPQLAAGIRSGNFVVENADEDCTGHCAYRTTCRVNQIRPLAVSLNKIGNIVSPMEDDRGSGE